MLMMSPLKLLHVTAQTAHVTAQTARVSDGHTAWPDDSDCSKGCKAIPQIPVAGDAMASSSAAGAGAAGSTAVPPNGWPAGSTADKPAAAPGVILIHLLECSRFGFIAPCVQPSQFCRVQAHRLLAHARRAKGCAACWQLGCSDFGFNARRAQPSHLCCIQADDALCHPASHLVVADRERPG